MGGGKQNRHRPSLGDPEDRRSLAARRVHHGLHVVHRLLQRRRPAEPIGEALPALVEDDQPREGGEATEEAGDRRLLPDELDVGHEPGHEDQFQRPFTVHLVRDAGAIG
jgi:hypothetical protein